MRYLMVALIAAAMVLPAMAGVVNTVVDTTVAGATINGTVSGGEYVGTVSGGGGGFGGPVGSGTVSVDSSATGIQIGFSSMGDISGNSIRVYFDTTPGGYTELSTAAGFNDVNDFGRGRLSRPASNGLILPFAADYGWIISPAFGGFQALFQLVPGGDNSLIYTGNGIAAAGSPNGGNAIAENPSNSTFEFDIPYADLGIAQGATVDFVVIYANNNDAGSAYMSDEGFPYQVGGGNPGNGPVTLTDFHRLVTTPEPATLVLLAVGGMVLARRRRVA